MKQTWMQLQGWFQARNQREKILLAIVLCGGVLMLAHLFWIGPAQEALDAEHHRYTQQRTEVANLREEAQRFESQLAIDPNDELNRRESELTARKNRLEARLEERAQLMPARASVHWIDALLDMPSGLELVQFDTQRAVPMVVPDQGVEQSNLWQHPVQLVVEGQYHDLRDYVEGIEALQYPFYWDTLRYEVEQFPDARLTIRVYALSTQEELLGG